MTTSPFAGDDEAVLGAVALLVIGWDRRRRSSVRHTDAAPATASVGSLVGLIAGPLAGPVARVALVG